jgi:hypothetical protein
MVKKRSEFGVRSPASGRTIDFTPRATKLLIARMRFAALHDEAEKTLPAIVVRRKPWKKRGGASSLLEELGLKGGIGGENSKAKKPNPKAEL